MRSPLTTSRGYTLIEVLMVVGIIAILLALLLTGIVMARRSLQKQAARQQLATMEMAFAVYRNDYKGDFPPDNGISTNGSEIIWYYLVNKHRLGEADVGPYLPVKDQQLRPGSGTNKKVVSPLGGDYYYVLIEDADGLKRSYKLVDPGFDKQLGANYVTTGAGAGSLTVTNPALEEDNIYSAK